MAKNRALSLRAQWLGERLRAARLKAGLTLEEVADYLHMRHTTLSRFENGVYRVRPSYIRDLIDFYGVADQRERDVLLQLNEDAWRKDWWTASSDGFDMEFIDYTWLESRAAHICVFESMLIHGLLQTEDYAHALTQDGMSASADDATIQELVRIRMNRQRILTGPDATKLSIVFEEAPFHRTIGTTGVHVAQLQAVCDIAKQPHVEVRVLPRNGGWHQGLDGPFTYIDMPDPYPDVAYVEYMSGRIFLEEESKVENYRRAYTAIEQKAWSPAESEAYIKDLVKELQ